MRYCGFLILLSAAGFAYNLPTDTAGPLTVSIAPPAVGAYGAGGYADMSRPGTAFVVPVSLQNAGDQPISGTLRVAVIDRWQATPSGPVAFRIGPRGRSRHEFTLSFGPGTYNAHYPIHAYAEFEFQGKKLVAHPVLLVQPRIPDLPRPKLPAEWKPVPVPKGGTLGLWRMPVRRESAEIVNAGADAGQTGREVFDAGSIILYGSIGSGREGIAMTLGKRPPSNRETVDSAAVEYPLALPAVKPLRLQFLTAGHVSFEVKAAPYDGGAVATLFKSHGGKGMGTGEYRSRPVRRNEHPAAFRGPRPGWGSAVGRADHRSR